MVVLCKTGLEQGSSTGREASVSEKAPGAFYKVTPFFVSEGVVEAPEVLCLVQLLELGDTSQRQLLRLQIRWFMGASGGARGSG